MASMPPFHHLFQMQEDQGVLATNLRLLALHSRLLGPLLSSSTGEEAGLVLPFTGPVLSLLLQLLETGKLEITGKNFIGHKSIVCQVLKTLKVLVSIKF